MLFLFSDSSITRHSVHMKTGRFQRADWHRLTAPSTLLVSDIFNWFNGSCSNFLLHFEHEISQVIVCKFRYQSTVTSILPSCTFHQSLMQIFILTCCGKPQGRIQEYSAKIRILVLFLMVKYLIILKAKLY